MKLSKRIWAFYLELQSRSWRGRTGGSMSCRMIWMLADENVRDIIYDSVASSQQYETTRFQYCGEFE
eukprot:scaffold16155_cov67-Skeletonema_dohrnii-CCMP3373.AAC.2